MLTVPFHIQPHAVQSVSQSGSSFGEQDRCGTCHVSDVDLPCLSRLRESATAMPSSTLAMLIYYSGDDMHAPRYMRALQRSKTAWQKISASLMSFIHVSGKHSPWLQRGIWRGYLERQ